MKKLSFKQQLWAFALMSLLFLILQGAVALWQIGKLNSLLEDINGNSIPSIMHLDNMKFSIQRNRGLALRVAITTDAKQGKGLIEKIEKQDAKMLESIANYEKLVTESDEIAALKVMKQNLDVYQKSLNDIMQKAQGGDTAGAVQDLNVTSQDVYNNLMKSLDSLVDINQKQASANEVMAKRLVSQSRVTIGLMAALCGLLGMVLAYGVVRSIGGGMAELGRVFESLSRLDLRVKGRSEGNNEVANVLKQFNKTVSELTGVVGSTQETSHTVSAAAHELTATMENIAATTHQQEAALTSIAASLEETSASAGEVNQKAQRSGRATDEIVNAINVVLQNVGELSGNADAIGSVLGVIKGISEQINLLSLNAAIEAARAGDAGRGFAVVADEVRKLAGSTSKSTDEIAKVVTDLQSSVGKTKNALDTVGGALDEVRNNSTSVVAAVGEQTIAINTISSSIGEFRDQMASVMNNVQEAQAASEGLSRSAEDLNIQTAKFKV